MNTNRPQLELFWNVNETRLKALYAERERRAGAASADLDCKIEELESAMDFIEYCAGFDGPPKLRSLERHSATKDLDCPFCIASIPANRNFLGRPTVRCWNCGMTFAAPDAWRDCTEDFLKAGEARMQEMADAYHACRLKQTRVSEHQRLRARQDLGTSRDASKGSS